VLLTAEEFARYSDEDARTGLLGRLYRRLWLRQRRRYDGLRFLHRCGVVAVEALGPGCTDQG
jgi:hypothetical protein